MTIRPVGAELFHADGRTDGHDEANCRFSQFCEGAQKVNLYIVSSKPHFYSQSIRLEVRKAKKIRRSFPQKFQQSLFNG